MQDIIKEFYDGYDEDGRLARHKLELVRSKIVISRYLSAEKMNIADIGGASGVYSCWLASLGHRVHLLDLVPKHIRQAREKAANTGVELAEYICGDARDLPYGKTSFDLVLEMGPLYHLQQRNERVRCLRECHRVLREGCHVICAVISRYAPLIEGFSYGFANDADYRESLEQGMSTGCHDNPELTENRFTTAYFHTPGEIRGELEEAGFADVELIAVEGFAYAMRPDELYEDHEVSAYLLECIEKTEKVPELLGVTGHILAVGRKDCAAVMTS